MSSKTKLKNAAIAEKSASLPSIPEELLDQLVQQGPMTAASIQDMTMALKKALIERALGGELSHHLGYPPGGERPAQAGNHRNGSSAKTVLTQDGPLRIEVPRDRVGSFEPLLVPKHERRFTGFDDKIVALYARGMTVREIQDRCITPRKPNKPCSNDSRRMIAMDSFFLMGAKPLVQDSPSMKLHELLDWHSIAGHLKGLYQREKSGAGGPEPYNRLGMFKLMLLGQWHGLSDAQLEQALRVRLDFMVFTGFEPSAGELPDASTICRFRNRLVTAGLDQNLLTLINGQLEQLGLKVQGARGAIIDATIIPSAARPNRYLEEGQPAQVIDSPDAEARWVKKGKDAFFGYRGHTAVDSEDGYVEHVQVRPANEAEITRLPDIVDALKPGVVAVLADKGYASKANRQFLQERGIGDLIQHKGSRGHPLHPLYSQFNKKIGAIRFKVEQAFGTMKRRFNLARARYFGTAKVQAQMCWAALGMNLLKAHRKLKAMELAGVGAP